MLIHERLTARIIGAAIEIHREPGPGWLESTHEERLCYELSQRSLTFRRQVELPVTYKRIRLDCGYVADFIVEGRVLLELKSVERNLPIFESQLLTYLKITGLQVGLLMNFNVSVMKDGIIRRVV